MIVCPNCGQNHRESTACPSGTVVVYPLSNSPAPSTKHPFKCPICEGSGRIMWSIGANTSGQPCRSCDGTGIVWGPPDASDSSDALDERAAIVKMLRNISRAAMTKEGLEVTRESWKDIDRFDELPPHMAELFVRMTSEVAARCAASLADAIERGEHRKTGP